MPKTFRNVLAYLDGPPLAKYGILKGIAFLIAEKDAVNP
jgi:hypothetical protein